MLILNTKMTLKQLEDLEEESFFDDMVKAVVDINKEIIAVSAELHSDLEELLLDHGSSQKSLYGINIYYDSGEIEFDSLINPPRNRDDGYPRGGRYVASPESREKIERVVRKWIEI